MISHTKQTEKTVVTSACVFIGEASVYATEDTYVLLHVYTTTTGAPIRVRVPKADIPALIEALEDVK